MNALIIKSNSWEISAWNPKDSAMFWVLSGKEETGGEGERGSWGDKPTQATG